MESITGYLLETVDIIRPQSIDDLGALPGDFLLTSSPDVAPILYYRGIDKFPNSSVDACFVTPVYVTADKSMGYASPLFVGTDYKLFKKVVNGQEAFRRLLASSFI